MITTIIDLDLDQQHSKQQTENALELFISGQKDGFEDGVRPASSEVAYLRGYAQGCRRKMADIQHQSELLEAEGLAVEATVEAMFGEKIPF